MNVVEQVDDADVSEGAPMSTPRRKKSVAAETISAPSTFDVSDTKCRMSSNSVFFGPGNSATA
jgi:hypothetical protein